VADACSFAEQVLDRVEGTRPIAVCRSTGVDEQVQLAEAGYVGFASATASADELIAQIRSVMRDESQCTPQFVGALLRTIRKRTSQASDATSLGSLSQREREVAILLQNRFSNKQIAAELGIEFGTAKNHVHNVLTKLNVETRWEVTHLVWRNEPRPVPVKGNQGRLTGFRRYP
jgi:DNA-binding NarL/FixJ family response regulator